MDDYQSLKVRKGEKERKVHDTKKTEILLSLLPPPPPLLLSPTAPLRPSSRSLAAPASRSRRRGAPRQGDAQRSRNSPGQHSLAGATWRTTTRWVSRRTRRPRTPPWCSRRRVRGCPQCRGRRSSRSPRCRTGGAGKRFEFSTEVEVDEFLSFFRRRQQRRTNDDGDDIECELEQVSVASFCATLSVARQARIALVSP